MKHVIHLGLMVLVLAGLATFLMGTVSAAGPLGNLGGSSSDPFDVGSGIALKVSVPTGGGPLTAPAPVPVHTNSNNFVAQGGGFSAPSSTTVFIPAALPNTGGSLDATLLSLCVALAGLLCSGLATLGLRTLANR